MKRMTVVQHGRLGILLTLLPLAVCLMASAELAQAQGGDVPDNVSELIVLLEPRARRADTPAPE